MDLIGVCKCCNKRIQITIESDKISNDISFENYKKYKDFKVNRCPHCDYISEKLFTENPPEHIEYLLKSGNYEYVLDYDYIAEEVDRDLWEYDITAFNANEYEAYALVCQLKKDIPGEIKSLFKCINLKEALIRRFRKITNEECDDEDWSDINGAIENRIQASINVNLKEIDKAYKNSTDHDVFTKLIMVEAYVKADKKKEAKALFDSVKKGLDKGLLDYFENILM